MSAFWRGKKQVTDGKLSLEYMFATGGLARKQDGVKNKKNVETVSERGRLKESGVRFIDGGWKSGTASHPHTKLSAILTRGYRHLLAIVQHHVEIHVPENSLREGEIKKCRNLTPPPAPADKAISTSSLFIGEA